MWIHLSLLVRDSVYLLDLTLPTPAENLALDEALLDASEQSGPCPVLRLWESAEHFVVLGRSSQAAGEVRLSSCAQDGVPVLRRVSGGGTVVAGPGCLMYALVLPQSLLSKPRAIDQAHSLVLGRIEKALSQLGCNARSAGLSDLVLPDRNPPKKFSGNSLRMRSRCFLYHGTLLYDFPLEKLNHWLGTPARTPDYRDSRSHGTFVANLPLTGDQLRAAIIDQWQADTQLVDWPRKEVARLVEEKYSRPTWNRVDAH